MHIYLKNNPVEFHSDPFCNARAVGFFEAGHPNN